jgi:hypothetical protein
VALPGPRRPILGERWIPVALVLVQALFALALARLLAWRGLGPEVVVATGGALLLLVLAARLVMGRHPWSND